MFLTVKHIIKTTILAAILSLSCFAAHSQSPQSVIDRFMAFEVQDGDTVYVDVLTPAKVVSKLPKQKGKEWRKYYRLVYNFPKVWPYALAAQKVVQKTDSTILADHLKGMRRDAYIEAVKGELFELFADRFRHMTVSQGQLLIRLTDRQIGVIPYDIIKGYTSGITAGFWEGIAKLFSSSLKDPYDPKGIDRETEELIELWERGEFDDLYYHLFWEYPEPEKVPEKYR